MQLYPSESQPKGQHLLTISTCTLIILLSILNFAAYYRTNLNSDHAIHILMAADLRLPEDLYYWGQDRLGSLVPILAHGMLQVLPLQPVVAVSIVQYLILIAGFLAFASLLQSRLLTVILALVWFLPLSTFDEFVSIAHPYSPQLAFVGFAILLARSLLSRAKPGEPVNQPWRLAAIVLCAFLAIWISEFSAIIFFFLTLAVLIDRCKTAPAGLTLWQKIGLTRADWGAIAASSLLGIAFILFAQEHATRHVRGYSSLNTLQETQEVIAKLVREAIASLTFQYGFFFGIQAILGVVVLAGWVYLWRTRRSQVADLSPWFWGLFGSAVSGFLLLLCLNWVHHNQIDLRYFSIIYSLLWLAALFFAQSLRGRLFRRVALLLLCTALAASLTTPQVLARDRSPSTIARLQPFRALAPAGFIGDYWASYLICAADPAALDCTPHEQDWQTPCDPSTTLSAPVEPEEISSRLRCPRCTKRALSAPTVYAIRGRWLGEQRFPKEMQQFGVCLVRTGPRQRVGRYAIAPYRLK